jgi:hypothetical protein
VVDCDDGTLFFRDMQLTVRLSPVAFAIYRIYLDHEDGFNNKHRTDFEDLALRYFHRLRGQDEAGIAAVKNCFNLEDDKPLRDIFYKIKSLMARKMGSKEIAEPYVIQGPNGGIKRIAIPRANVTYGVVDRP